MGVVDEGFDRVFGDFVDQVDGKMSPKFLVRLLVVEAMWRCELG